MRRVRRNNVTFSAYTHSARNPESISISHRTTMPTTTYALFRNAILDEQQVVGT